MEMRIVFIFALTLLAMVSGSSVYNNTDGFYQDNFGNWHQVTTVVIAECQTTFNYFSTGKYANEQTRKNK